MAEKQTPIKLDTFLLFRRYVSGIAVVCVIVTVIASMKVNVSVYEVTLRATIVCLVIMGCQWIMVRALRAWSLAQSRPKNRLK